MAKNQPITIPLVFINPDLSACAGSANLRLPMARSYVTPFAIHVADSDRALFRMPDAPGPVVISRGHLPCTPGHAVPLN